MDQEELLQIIDSLRTENEELKRRLSEPRHDLIPANEFREKYPKTTSALWSTETQQLSGIVRRSCFPRSAIYKSGKYGSPATIRLTELTDEQYAKYITIMESIFKVFEPNVLDKYVHHYRRESDATP